MTGRYADYGPGAMQVLCVDGQVDGNAGRSAPRRPSGTRKRGQPNRWARSPENRKRCAAVQPTAWHICKAVVMKLGAPWGRSMPPRPRTSQRLAVENGGPRTDRAGKACQVARRLG